MDDPGEFGSAPTGSTGPKVIGTSIAMLLGGVIGAATLMWWWATGIRGKEDCSAAVGSIEIPTRPGSDPRMYSPCDLVGYMDALVVITVIGVITMVLIPGRRARAIIGVLILVVVFAVAIKGNDFLRV